MFPDFFNLEAAFEKSINNFPLIVIREMRLSPWIRFILKNAMNFISWDDLIAVLC